MVINFRKGVLLMKRKYILTGVVLTLALSLSACGNGATNDYAKVLTEVKTTQFFSDEKMATVDMEKILSAGVNAPSAMNTQPWHFTAVTDEGVMEKLASAMSSMKPPAMPDGMNGKMKPPGMHEDGKGKYLSQFCRRLVYPSGYGKP